MTEPVDQKRRRFLTTTSTAVLLSGSTSWCGTGGSGDGGKTVEVFVSMIPLNGLHSPAASDPDSILIGRDAMGVYAFTNKCTHAACAVGLPKSGKLECSCHRSQFDLNGNVTKIAEGGSISQPSLKHYKVTIRGTGNSALAVVDLSTEEIDRNARTPVPA